MSYEIDEDSYLEHYGILRRSGRYPWGSGGSDNYDQRTEDFLAQVNKLRKAGMTDVDIARSFSTDAHPYNTTMLRAETSIARNRQRAANIAQAQRLKDKGYSNGAIAERMGLPGESSVRALLEPGAKVRTDQLQAITGKLKQQVDDKGYIDVGIGVERYSGVSRTQFDTALAALKSEGYHVVNVQIDQVGSGSQKTTTKVLAPPGMTDKEHYVTLVKNPELIKTVDSYSKDGLEFTDVHPPISLNSKRLDVRYAEQGGADADGVMYIRPGAKDLDLGGAQYAQVRIAVDGTHYLKGMAVYKEDLPDGVDVQFNTNKSDTGNKLDALKPMNKTPDGKVDMENPFGATIKPGGQRGVLNVVNEEGDWHEWSKSLASQMLSKQKPTLAAEQLGKLSSDRQKEFDEISSLTNPEVKKKLLQSFADGVDSDSVHLQAAAMPRQATQVILPVSKLKPTEIYAPNFKDGERVALVRYPHGGTFEIPELTVNNRNPSAIALLGKQAKDAVGIHPKVAERLSGADFDGDTVLVIPNNHGKIKSTAPLEALKGFDPKKEYPYFEGMKVMTPKQKQHEMGNVSNLITDMTIKGAPPSEIANAVKHSMVVIDAEKHKLNYRQSYLDNGIANLKKKYQGVTERGQLRGAATIISRSTSEIRVPKRKMGYKIDPSTGEKIFKETGESYIGKNGKVIPKTSSSTKGAEAKDAHILTSAYDSHGRLVGNAMPIEELYANHANNLKTLANAARKELVSTPSIPYSPSAKKVYAKEVDSLDAKLNVALKNAPKERQAQLVANTIVRQKKADNPAMTPEEIKKASGKALIEARSRLGAKKEPVKIEDNEWEAIQAGAISSHKLKQILDNANLDAVKKLATPRTPTVMTSAKQARAEGLLNAGKTPSEVAQILGVALSTLNSSIERSKNG